VEDRLAKQQFREVFVQKAREFAQELDARDRAIVEQRILAAEPCTLQELGEAFGVSRERIRQLETRVVERLREFLEENLVDFEYYAPTRD
jgi:RNA polymerase sigma-32 factor